MGFSSDTVDLTTVEKHEPVARESGRRQGEQEVGQLEEREMEKEEEEREEYEVRTLYALALACAVMLLGTALIYLLWKIKPFHQHIHSR